ncbi:hypothetical protein HUG17_10120 [Dermatophagoides farinae]|uniref:Ribonuclease H1 n=1 Tax=Dermatophagoides farinae TaxID=6954 RepID=A0A9D4P4C3_DERFA|nr:ribonuclease H1-like [Dermatophagoides farinae]KAH7643429.1 hypothetical protein HUG17_10120 [Dermatophagoides farinae]
MFYYAVAIGRQTGIFNDWNDCEKQVKGFKNAKFKKFKTKSEAEEFIHIHHKSTTSSSSISNSNLVPKILPTTSTANNSAVRINAMSMPRSSSHQPSKLTSDDKKLTTGIFSSLKCPKRPRSRKSDFLTIRRNHLGDPIVYTDGACCNNGKRNAKAGIGVFWAIDHNDNVSRLLVGRQTNNRAEIEAAIVAIQTALKNNYRTLDIHTDSKFIIVSMTEWLPKWKRNGWKLSTGESVKNKHEFMRLDEEMNKMDRLIWTKVRAHSGDYGNEMADQLATNSIK